MQGGFTSPARGWEPVTGLHSVRGLPDLTSLAKRKETSVVSPTGVVLHEMVACVSSRKPVGLFLCLLILSGLQS
eukprot:3366268-Amphidinium_carterae.1